MASNIFLLSASAERAARAEERKNEKEKSAWHRQQIEDCNKKVGSRSTSIRQQDTSSSFNSKLKVNFLSDIVLGYQIFDIFPLINARKQLEIPFLNMFFAMVHNRVQPHKILYSNKVMI